MACARRNSASSPLQRSSVVTIKLAPRVALATVVAVAGMLAVGCGRRQATEEDCRLIVDKLVEVELRAMKTTDAETIAKKQETIRAQMTDSLKDCRTHRVSDSMLNCVKAAKATDEILDCIR